MTNTEIVKPVPHFEIDYTVEYTYEGNTFSEDRFFNVQATSAEAAVVLFKEDRFMHYYLDLHKPNHTLIINGVKEIA